MLVFTRKRDEAIVIGDGIEVRILRVGKDGVRLGVTAPPEVPVHRQEIYQMVGAANLSAATAPANAKDDTSMVERLATRLRRDSAASDLSAEAVGRSAANADLSTEAVGRSAAKVEPVR
jgi:carbon storage regulator